MYEVIADIRNKPTECLYGIQSGGYYQIISDEYENKVLIKASYEQVDNLFNDLKKSSGEATYNELLDKIDKLEIQLENQSNLIE